MGRARGAATGGISGLVSLLERDGEAIDADLQHFYGLSLGDVLTGRVTLRRLRDLLRGLPPDGTAVWRKRAREAAGKPAEPGRPLPPEWWTPERDLLASLVDAQALRLWQAAGGKGPKPRPIRRPGVTGKSLSSDLPQSRIRAVLDRLGGRSPRRGKQAAEERDAGRAPDHAEDHPGDGEARAAAGPGA